MAELPIVADFDLNGFRFVDVRRDGQLRAQARAAQREAVDTLFPRDLLCSVGDTRRRDLAIATEAAWERGGFRQRPEGGRIIPRALLAEEIARFAEAERVRHSGAILAGDVAPLTFAMQRAGQFFGAWQWYAIRVVHQQKRLVVRVGHFPAFPGLTLRDLARRSIDLAILFVRRNRAFPFVDGSGSLDVAQVSAPLVEKAERTDTRIIQFARERLEERAAAGEVAVDFADDPTQVGRRRLRITDTGVTPIQEPEIDALIGARLP